MTSNFNASGGDSVSINLTVSDVENLIFALGTATIPLISMEGNSSFVNTLDKLYTQTKAVYPDAEETEEKIKEGEVKKAEKLSRISKRKLVDPEDTPEVEIV